jgi:protein-tyrosine phosphatase
MDSSNYAAMKALPASGQNGAAKLFLMRDFDDLGKGQDVPDPYYGGDDGFRYVFELLDRSAQNLLDKIITDHHL